MRTHRLFRLVSALTLSVFLCQSTVFAQPELLGTSYLARRSYFPVDGTPQDKAERVFEEAVRGVLATEDDGLTEWVGRFNDRNASETRGDGIYQQQQGGWRQGIAERFKQSWIGRISGYGEPKIDFGKHSRLDYIEPSARKRAASMLVETIMQPMIGRVRGRAAAELKRFIVHILGLLPEGAEFSSDTTFTLYGTQIPGFLGRVLQPELLHVMARSWRQSQEVQDILLSTNLREVLERDMMRLRKYGYGRYADFIYASEVYDLLARRDAALLARHIKIPGDARVFAEMGAGTGVLLSAIAAKIVEEGVTNRFYLALESNKRVMQWGRWWRRQEKSPVRFMRAGPKNFPWLPGDVDIILAKESIFYPEGDFRMAMEFMNTAVQALRPGGQLVVIESGDAGERNSRIEFLQEIASELGMEIRSSVDVREPFILNTSNVYQMMVLVKPEESKSATIVIGDGLASRRRRREFRRDGLRKGHEHPGRDNIRQHVRSVVNFQEIAQETDWSHKQRHLYTGQSKVVIERGTNKLLFTVTVIEIDMGHERVKIRYGSGNAEKWLGLGRFIVLDPERSIAVGLGEIIRYERKGPTDRNYLRAGLIFGIPKSIIVMRPEGSGPTRSSGDGLTQPSANKVLADLSQELRGDGLQEALLGSSTAVLTEPVVYAVRGLPVSHVEGAVPIELVDGPAPLALQEGILRLAPRYWRDAEGRVDTGKVAQAVALFNPLWSLDLIVVEDVSTVAPNALSTIPVFHPQGHIMDFLGSTAFESLEPLQAEVLEALLKAYASQA